MSDFPEKASDSTNGKAVLIVGLATTVILWASVMFLQSYFMNSEGEFAAGRDAKGKNAEVRGLWAEQRADLFETSHLDTSKGTLKHLNVEHAKSAVIRDAQKGSSLIPSLGKLDAQVPVEAVPPASAPEPAPAPAPVLAPATP